MLLLLVMSLLPAAVVLCLADQAPFAVLILSLLAGIVSATAVLVVVGSRGEPEGGSPEA